MAADTLTTGIIGGTIALLIQVGNFLISYSKFRVEKKDSFEEQRLKFMETLMTRLEKVNEERDEAEKEAELYREKFWDEIEGKLQKLETRKKQRTTTNE